ncbi:nucleoporin NDC1 [Pectinophora gossypiella]|uniref:Nucleoporin NDC1 n=1 Tax=Pectinophora gossypiella TaxID=13191 RepID=A0A1E1WE81_PECGO|nr:nucleoporin NDC1 [Pectinophora gossypiella]
MAAGMERKSEIFSQRLIVAVLWNLALQTFLAVSLVFLIQVDILHPLSWIASTFQDIFSWKMSLNIVLLGLVSFFQAYIYGCYYMVPPPKYFTRFSMFLNLFSIQNMIFSVLYALCGYFTMGLYSSLAQSNFNVLKKTCKNYDGQCLMEQSLFLQFGGMWMGLYYFLNVHIFSTNILMFPHIYQDKFQQIKLAISNIIALGFKKSIMPVAYYCIFYYLWGNKPRNVVSDVYSLYLEDAPLDNMLNLISSGIWIGLWFYTSLFLVSVYTMKTIFNIVLTEPMRFPIESDRSLTLHNALAQKLQFNGYLGAQDFRIMAITDSARRIQVFKLSQPGGHPRNWNHLLEVSLSTINNFSKELEIINGDGKPLGLDNSPQKKSLNITPPSGLMYNNLRNMAHSPELLELKDHNRNKVDNTFTTVMKEECYGLLHKLCQKPGINYFFGELTDTKLKFLLTQAQPVMWTCEGLAFIAASSLKEDKYGIVQTDLPIVISALINLKQSLDKISKPGLVPRKHILHDELAIRMKSALISSVKRSIYKIVITFSKYIHEIPLDPDVQVAIQPFLLCKEA